MSKYYKFLMYLLIVILVNVAGVTLFYRVDLTANGLYSLSDVSKRVVSTLKEPLTINVFFTKNLPAPYNNLEVYLHDLLEEYEIFSNNNLSYRFEDVTAKEGDVSQEAEENRKKAQSYGIYPINVQKIEQDEVKVQQAYMGMALLHGDLVGKIPEITTTESLEYKITRSIQRMNNKISALANLQSKIKVILMQSSSLSQISGLVRLEGLDAFRNKVQEVVNRLNSKNYGQLELVYEDPSISAETNELLNLYQRFGLQWPELTPPAGVKVPAGKGMVVLQLSNGKKSVERNMLDRKMALTNRGVEEQYFLVDTPVIEAFINDNIDTLIDVNEDIGYVKSNGTQRLTPKLPDQYMPGQQRPMDQEALNKLNGILNREYSVKEIDLEKEEIPDSIDTLIIAGPKENFSDWQLFQIDQFLMKGKSIAIFIDAFNEIQAQNQQNFQQPVYLPINSGIEKLLDHYGLKVKKSYLLDEDCYVNKDRNGNEMNIYFAPLIKGDRINQDPDFMSNIKQMIMVKISPLEAEKEKIERNGLKLTQLFTSSEQSWEMSGRINLMPFMIQPPADNKEKFARPLAYLLEGEFPSYFAGKTAPGKPTNNTIEPTVDPNNPADSKPNTETKPASPAAPTPTLQPEVKAQHDIISKGKPGRIFLLGTSEILKDTVMDEEGASPNAVFLMNTLDFLNNQEDVAVMRSKEQQFNPLDDKIKPFTKTIVNIFNIGGLPALFIVFGLIVWVRRTARKKQIQAIFTKSN